MEVPKDLLKLSIYAQAAFKTGSRSNVKGSGILYVCIFLSYKTKYTSVVKLPNFIH